MTSASTESTKPAPSTGEVTDDKKTEADEYVVPSVSTEEEDLEAKDFRTSDDAQLAFLRGQIDEDTFAAVVGRYGKPNNPPYNRRMEVQGAYENELPKWAFDAPEGLGLDVHERIEAVEKKAEERENQEPGYIRSDTGEVKEYKELGTPYNTAQEPYTSRPQFTGEPATPQTSTGMTPPASSSSSS